MLRAAFVVIFIAIVGLVAWLVVRPSPFLHEVPWLPGWLGQWADAHPDLRTAVPFFALAAMLPLWQSRPSHLLRGDTLGYGALALLGILVLTESAQTLLPQRTFDLADLLWGALGIIAGLAFGLLAWLIWSGLYQPHPRAEPGKLRLRIWGINYAPEVTGIAVYNRMMAEWLARKGHAVSVFTTFPYYPAWRKRPKDHPKLYEHEEIHGIQVHRCWHFVPRRASTLFRIAHEASFIASSLLRILFSHRADAMVVVSPPLPLGLAAWMVRLIQRTPFIFHVQDLQPGAADGLGMVKNPLLLRALYRLEAFAYSKAACVSGIGQGMIKSFHTKGVPKTKTLFLPNAVDQDAPNASAEEAQRFRHHHGIQPDEFLVLYSGNLGRKQALDHVIQAFAQSRHPLLKLLICGEGGEKHRLLALADQHQDARIAFADLQPSAQYAAMLRAADICLVPQAPRAGANFLPSKLLSILAARRPVLAIADADSELARAIAESQTGIVLPTADPARLAETFDQLPTEQERLHRMTDGAEKYLCQFNCDRIHQTLLNTLTKIAQTSHNAQPLKVSSGQPKANPTLPTNRTPPNSP